MVPLPLSAFVQMNKNTHTQEKQACVELHSQLLPGKGNQSTRKLLKDSALQAHMGARTLLWTTAWHHGIMGLCGLHALTAHFIFHQDVIAHPALPSENTTVPQVTQNLNLNTIRTVFDSALLLLLPRAWSRRPSCQSCVNVSCKAAELGPYGNTETADKWQ